MTDAEGTGEFDGAAQVVGVLGPTPGSGLSGFPMQFHPVSSMPREVNSAT